VKGRVNGNNKITAHPLGGEQAEKTSKEICETWKDGFVGIDAVNHVA